jgi:alpha-N-arabinofuranosidase
VSASASKDASGALNISLTNIDFKKSHEVIINLRGEDFSKLSGQILASSNISDHNSFEEPNKVTSKDFSGAKLDKGVLKLTIPAYSVLVLNLKK